MLQEHGDSPCMFFDALLSMSVDRMASGDLEVMKRIADYVQWIVECCPRGENAGSDPFTMVVCAYIEHVPEHKDVFTFLAKHWGYAFKCRVGECLRHHGSEEDVAMFLRDSPTSRCSGTA